MSFQLDPSVPPHKTKPFWYIVALAVLMCVGYPLIAHSHGPLLLQVVPSVVTFIIMVCIAWFAVRRVQRGESYFTSRRITVRLIILAIGIILLIIASFLKKH
jgi:hypothetical protein